MNRYRVPYVVDLQHIRNLNQILSQVKDIVQPKKRGVKRGTIRFVLTSYTIADAFFVHVKG
jgi:hypothetical protein